MANIKLIDGDTPQWVLDLLTDIYVPMIDKINPIIAESLAPDVPPKIRKMLIEEAIKNQEWELYAIPSKGGYELSIRGPSFNAVRLVSKSGGFISHEFFEISGKLQSKGIAKFVMDASVQIADKLKIKNIILHANLDVGGYAWLRKGFFPKDKAALLYAMEGKSERRAAFTALVDGMSEARIREFVLTEEFREWKDLFLGADWEGKVDLNNSTSRAALTSSAKQAEVMINRGFGKPVTANEIVQDSLVRHQTYLMRYAGSVRNSATALLKATESDIQVVLLRYAMEYEGLSPHSKEGQLIFKKMAAEIEKIRSEAWSEIITSSMSEFSELATIEQAAVMKIIQAPFPVVLGLQPLPAAQLASIVAATPFEGRTLKEWLNHNKDIDYQRIVTNAKNAMASGQTPTQVARSVMGTSGIDYKDGQARKAFRDLESVYLTVTNGIGNQVKQDLYAANSDIIKNEIFVATLDIRTTIECGGNDGKVFKRGKGPIPPLHFRCRSLRMPYINPENLNGRPFDPSYEKMLVSDFAEQNGLGKITSVDGLPYGYKTAYTKWARSEVRSIVGKVPAELNFDKWLRNQTPDFQNEYLGIGRANIFRQGKLSLDKFVTRDGYELTIKELTKLAA